METMKPKEDLDEYLARIRKTIADSRELVAQAELRFAETDRLLESQGLTREQVQAMNFTEAQREAANRELVRRGMEPIDFSDGFPPPGAGPEEAPSAERESAPGGDEMENRRMKFSMMMKPFRI